MRDVNSILAIVLTLALAPKMAPAQPLGQQTNRPDGSTGPRLFLKYAGDPKMRLFGIAIGSDRSLYAVGGDSAAVGVDGYVSKVSIAGKEERIVAFKSSFVGPGIDLDAQGNLFLAGGDRIFRIAADGGVAVLASGFRGAFDLKLDPKGNLYIADHREGKIYRIAHSREETVLVDYHLSPGEFILGGLAFDQNYSHLYAYEAAKRTLWRYPMNAGGTVGAPELVAASAPPIFSFAVDEEGNIFGADFDMGEVVKIDSHGKVTYVTEHCGLKHPIGFRLGNASFFPGTAFVADDEGIKQVNLTER